MHFPITNGLMYPQKVFRIFIRRTPQFYSLHAWMTILILALFASSKLLFVVIISPMFTMITEKQEACGGAREMGRKKKRKKQSF